MHSFAAFPMHEVTAHPQAPEVLRLFAQYPGDPSLGVGNPMFQPLSTTGVPLALRADWEDVLATCRQLGATVVWPAVHGWGETHDHAVHRDGAYYETLLGIDRVRAADMEIGCNVFVTCENVAQFDTITADLLAHGVTQFAIEVASYLPTARSRHYGALRPTRDDLLPLVERMQALPGPFFHRDQWLHLADHTEAAYVHRALAATWPPTAAVQEELALVCRPNLDLYWGVAGRYRHHYGNLRRDDAQHVLQAAILDDRERTEDALWFDLNPIPQVSALAEQYGDLAGARIHLSAESVRRRWLDQAQQAQRLSGFAEVAWWQAAKEDILP
jgi:hypothetical protein